jgi:hypothetical protein
LDTGCLYLFGYGCFAIPATLFEKKYTYKSGVMPGLGMVAPGTYLFYRAMLTAGYNIDVSFMMFPAAIIVFNPGDSPTGVPTSGAREFGYVIAHYVADSVNRSMTDDPSLARGKLTLQASARGVLVPWVH